MKTLLSRLWYILCFPVIVVGFVFCYAYGAFLHGTDLAREFTHWLDS